MITPDTISRITDAARIEEVIGEFVSLKKRGTNHIGLCPFHNEKTPSFSVSPSKGIYKCFGCGAAGDSITFLKQHEHYTYPEALTWLAKKYNIEIEETESSPEQKAEAGQIESLYIVTAFASGYFEEQLHNSPEGQALGVSYFRERGFSADTIKKFKLGYCPEDGDVFTKNAFENGYKLEFLEKAGLTKTRDGEHYDGLRGRVIFPIHNLSGRVIAFGARTLKTDKKIPKYINSPENEIYHKGNVLYGIFYAKKTITEKDNCILAEGYTDVISLHQSGIENAVASSGTSLTQDQIRLIRRYTDNITILYDGDTAGIKASFRGIDLILEEGMNVKALLFPDGEDPDSFSKKISREELLEFIKKNSKDFIDFKTDLLFAEVKNDPLKRAEIIRDLIETVALIPEPIKLSEYSRSFIKKCAEKFRIDEQTLYNEFNRARKKAIQGRIKRKSQPQQNALPAASEIEIPDLGENAAAPLQDVLALSSFDAQERDIARILLQYSGHTFHIEVPGEDGKMIQQEVTVANFIIGELTNDNIQPENPVYRRIIAEFIAAQEQGRLLKKEDFLNHTDTDFRTTCIELVFSKYELHNWSRKNIEVFSEEQKLKQMVKGSIYSYKMKLLLKMIDDNQRLMDSAYQSGQPVEMWMKTQHRLNELKSQLGNEMGRVLVK